MPSARLTVARDPALAVVVRIFVGAVAERLQVADTSREDLRLAASELFAAAVQTGDRGDVSFTIARDGDHVALSAGIDPAAAEDGAERAAGGGRLELIRALFPDAELGRSVRISVPVEALPNAG